MVIGQASSVGSIGPHSIMADAGAPQYSETALFKAGTIFTNRSISYDMPREVRDMAMGDMNHDSLIDVVVVNRTSIFIYNGTVNGLISTSPWIISKPGVTDIFRLAVGDLNNDGMKDVAISFVDSSGDSRIAIFDQNTNFGLLADVLLPQLNPRQLVIGQFDNTVVNEVAVVCVGDPGLGSVPSVILLKSPFTGSLNRAIITVTNQSNPQLLSVGHVNSDNLQDLVVGDLNGHKYTVLTQPSPASALTSLWGSPGTRDIGSSSIADLKLIDNTGSGMDRDLVIANAAYNRVEIWQNTGSGLPASATRVLNNAGDLTSLGFGRLTGAASPDLFVLSSTSHDLRMYPRQSGQLYDHIYSRSPVNNAPVRVAVVNSGSPLAGAYVLSAGGGGSPALLEFFIYDGSKVSNADRNLFISGPGSEVAAGNVSVPVIATILAGQSAVLISNLDGTSRATLSVQSLPCGLVFSDLDSDGYDDLAVINQGSNTVSVFRGGPSFLSELTPDINIPLSTGKPYSITAGWFEFMGLNGLVMGCENGTEVIYNALGNTTHEILGPTVAYQRSAVAVGKFNNLGIGGDIAVLNATTGHIDIYYQKAVGPVGDAFPDEPDSWLNMAVHSPTSIASGDFDSDGLDDIAASTSSTSVFLFMNNYDAGFYTDTSSTTSFTLSDSCLHISSADLNDDGASDLVATYVSKPQIAMLLSTGTGFVNPINVTAGGLASGTFAGDVNSDGRDDILVSSAASLSLSYWLQQNLAPVSSIWLSGSSVTEGLTAGIVRFDATNSTDSFSDRSVLSYYWSFGASGSSTQRYGQHAFIKSGTYHCYLLVTDRGGLTNRTDFTITVADISPVASFTFDPDHGIESDTIVRFTDMSYHYDAIAWNWDFGDGGTSTEQNPTHVYVQNGTYQVWLHITDSDGKKDSFTADVHVDDLSPTAKIGASATTIDENGTVSFVDESTSFPDAIVSYAWDFDDGSPIVTTKDAVHRFPVKGIYNVTLTITDSDGSTAVAYVMITVNDTPPVASFMPSKTNPLEGEPVIFTDTSYSYDGIDTWLWEMGDGSTYNGGSFSHAYSGPGTYEVTLTVVDLDGVSSEVFSMTITVLPTDPTIGTIGAEDGGTTFQMDVSILLEVSAQPIYLPIVKYEWDFHYDDTEGFVVEGTTIGNQTSVTYLAPGTYTIRVRVWDHNSYGEKSLVLTVTNKDPVASFTTTPYRPDNYTFNAGASSDTPSDLASLQYRWDFGDGSGWTTWSSAKIAWYYYSVAGTYVVTLEVRDQWGAVATTTRTVDPIKPTLDAITAGGGELSFKMDDVVLFKVTGHPTSLPFIRYAWDFDYDGKEGFTETPGITINQTSWVFTEAREYVICVRAYDSYTYVEQFITISILNVRPSASLAKQENGPGNFTFDGSLSSDTASDELTLEFRWNFDDGTGWTAWSTDRQIVKYYSVDGSYLVTMQVRDQWGMVASRSISVIVDREPPSILLENSSLPAHVYVGEDLVIMVNVTDISTVSQVILIYEWENKSYIVPMSRIAGTNTYVGIIKAINGTGSLSFHVEAEDAGGYHSVSTAISLAVIERPSETTLYIVAVALATIVAILLVYLWYAKMVVDEVFIIYEDGNLIAHQTRRLKPGMDDQILGSMLVAIQNFVRESFKDEGSTALNRMDFGEKKVLVEKGNHIYLAVVLHGKREGKVPQRMKDTIEQAEAEYKDALTGWDGDLEKVRGIKDSTSTLLKGSVLDFLPAKGPRTEEAESAAEVDTIECPVCDAKVAIDEVRCPQCRTELGTAGLKELADVADELKRDG